jgi:hypothetical protein
MYNLKLELELVIEASLCKKSEIILMKPILNKFLIIKAKYNVIEPYYMEGTTPDGRVVFSGPLPHDIN